MKRLDAATIAKTVSRLCIQANTHLRPDVRQALKKAEKAESRPRARIILDELLENARIARADQVALCQDTGLPVVFADVGRDVDLRGIDLAAAIQKGIDEGYRKGYLRDSIVLDPFQRQGVARFSPAVVHFDFGPHRGLRLTVLPKGFGCENKTQMKMFNPTAPMAEIRDFIVEAVKNAGPDACPPYVVGVGVGGSADYATLLAKKALLKRLGKRHPARHVARLEKEALAGINRLGLGPMGLGGKTTAFDVHILTYPTHIAGLPVAVNISCHVLRSASALLK